MGGQGIDMLVPTLLEWGTEEQKQQYIESTLHGETIWCQVIQNLTRVVI